jgi:hypothetical protein
MIVAEQKSQCSSKMSVPVAPSLDLIVHILVVEPMDAEVRFIFSQCCSCSVAFVCNSDGVPPSRILDYYDK